MFLPLFICFISLAITSCTKEAKSPVATNVSSATVKIPTNTTTTTQSQPTTQSGGDCHHTCGSGSGCSGSGSH